MSDNTFEKELAKAESKAKERSRERRQTEKYNKEHGIFDENAVCPYCGCQFPIMPGKKKKCPGCSKSPRVRTNPIRNTKMLVTGKVGDILDRHWTAIDFPEEEYNSQRAIGTIKRDICATPDGTKWKDNLEDILVFVSKLEAPTTQTPATDNEDKPDSGTN